MKDIIRAGAAVPDVRPGNVAYNLEQIRKYIASAKEKQVDLLVFPELAISGYTCGDLFFNDTLISAVRDTVPVLAGDADGIAFAVGAPVRVGYRLFNCALFFADRRLVGVVPKTFLAHNGAEVEKRYFAPGTDAETGFINLGGFDVPFGRSLLFTGSDGVSVGIEICEDLWSPFPPSSFLALAGADVILNLSASMEMAGKRSSRRTLIQNQSAKTLSLYVYTSAGMHESTADYICSGHAMIASVGEVLAENKKFVDNDYMLVADADLAAARADRQKIARIGDTAAFYGAFGEVEPVNVGISFTRNDPPADMLKLRRLPFVPDKPDLLCERVECLFEMQTAALAHRLELTHCRPVVGVSGGLDSTLALLVAVSAVESLGRPASDVLGITMPCFGTSGATFDNSLALMSALGIESRTVKIGDSVKQHFADIGHATDVYDAAYENSQARERTQVLMDVANMENRLVVGTGDLSELALGWCTYNGDQMSMYAVNSALPKTLIREMVRVLADTERFSPARDSLLTVVGQPISPELLPPDAKSGKIAQKTEDIVGPYELHDFFIYYFVRYGFGPRKIFSLAKLAFAGEYSDEVIKKWLVTFSRRFFTQQFKRSCSPDGILTGTVSLSPRGGFNLPSDADGSLWRAEAENL